MRWRGRRPLVLGVMIVGGGLLIGIVCRFAVQVTDSRQAPVVRRPVDGRRQGCDDTPMPASGQGLTLEVSWADPERPPPKNLDVAVLPREGAVELETLHWEHLEATGMSRSGRARAFVVKHRGVACPGRVIVRAEGAAIQSILADVWGGALQVVICEAAVLDVRLEWPEVPRALGQVLFVCEKGDFRFTRRVAAENGRAVFEYLDAGDWGVSAVWAEGMSLIGQTRARVEFGQHRTVEMRGWFPGGLEFRCRTEYGRPVTGAEVRLLAKGVEVASMPRGAVLTACTGATGNAVFRALPPGSYEAEVRCFGMHRWRGDEIEVSDGGAVLQVDVVLVASGQIAGRIVDELGEGIEGATVTCLLPGEAEGDGEARATAGPGGEYEAQVPKGGLFDLLVRAAGYFPRRIVDLSLSSGLRARGYDIQLKRAVRITGLVVNAEGEPDPKAQVKWRGASVAHNGKTEGSVAVQPNGRFTIETLSVGEFEVRAAGWDGRVSDAETVLCSLADGNKDLVLVLGKAKCSIKGTVRTSTGEIVSGELLFSCPSGPMTFGRPGSTTIDESGHFVIADLGSGRHVLSIGMFNQSKYSLRRSHVQAGVEGSVDLVAYLSAYVTAKLRGADGRPVCGKVKIITIPSEDLGERSAVHQSLHRRIGADGAIRTGPLAPGRWLIVIEADRYQPVALREVSVREGENKDLGVLSLSEGARLTVSVSSSSGGAVRAKARLFEAGTSEPWARSLSYLADKSGRIDTRSCLVPGKVDILLVADGFAGRWRRGVSLVGGTTSKVKLTLAAGRRLICHVNDNQGSACPGQSVALTTTDGRRDSRLAGVASHNGFMGWTKLGTADLAVTDDLGRALFEHVPAGDFSMRVEGAPDVEVCVPGGPGSAVIVRVELET
jgi:Carboxypeptidase regulatory-like domain